MPLVDSEPDITFFRDDDQVTGNILSEGIGVSGYEAKVTLDNKNNIIDVVEVNSGEFWPFMHGARGKNEYDNMKNPFYFLDTEIRMYWSFGLPLSGFR